MILAGEVIYFEEIVDTFGYRDCLYLYETDNLFYFCNESSSSGALYQLNFNTFELKKIYEDMYPIILIENTLYLEMRGYRHKLYPYFFNFPTVELSEIEKYTYLTNFLKVKHYRDDTFLGIKNVTKNGYLGMGYIDYEIHLIDNSNKTSKILITDKRGQGIIDITRDKFHILLDNWESEEKEYTSIVNLQTKKETSLPDHGLFAYFLTNNLVIVPERDTNNYSLFDLNGNEVGKYQLGGADLKYIIFFNNMYYGIASYRGLSYSTEASIVDTTLFRESLVKKKLLFVLHKGIITKDAPLYLNPAYQEPFSSIKKGTSVTIIDRSGIKVKQAGKYHYWYRLHLDDNMKPWIFGDSIELKEEIKNVKKEPPSPWIKKFLYRNYRHYKPDKYLYHPIKAFDGNEEAKWAEGSKGSGIGDYIGFELNESVLIDKIELIPGTYTKKAYNNFNQIKRCRFIFDNNKEFEFSFEDKMMKHMFALKETVKFQSFKLIIEELYPKNPDKDISAITEITFYYKDNKIEPALFKHTKYFEVIKDD